MENKFFRPASDLREEKSDLIYPKKADENLTPFRNPGDIESGYFKPAGDLDAGLTTSELGTTSSNFTPFRTPEEMVDYFRPASDLREEKSDLIYPKKADENLTPFRNPGDIESGYFKPAGDLDTGLTTSELGTASSNFTPFRTPEEMVDYFRPAENLNDINNEITKKINNNEEIINKTNNNIDKIKDYLLTIVSGKKDYVCELGVLDGAGEMVVSFERLMQMVEEGYNIVKAEVINANMILIEFQKYKHDEERVEGRKRF